MADTKQNTIKILEEEIKNYNKIANSVFHDRGSFSYRRKSSLEEESTLFILGLEVTLHDGTIKEVNVMTPNIDNQKNITYGHFLRDMIKAMEREIIKHAINGK